MTRFILKEILLQREKQFRMEMLSNRKGDYLKKFSPDNIPYLPDNLYAERWEISTETFYMYRFDYFDKNNGN